jgi:hypothetical protein
MDNEEYGQIFDRDVYQTVCNGEVIEEYPDDKPYPSILIFGRTETGRPLHLVCAYNKEDDSAIVITVYQPDPNMWIEFKRRNQT